MVNTSFCKTWTLNPCHEHYEHIPKFVLFQLWKVLTPSPPPSGSTTTPRVAGAGSSACAPCWSRWAVVGGGWSRDRMLTSDWSPGPHHGHPAQLRRPLHPHPQKQGVRPRHQGGLHVSRWTVLCTDTMVIRLIASLICNLDKYKSTPCSILPLFPSPEDISWK